MPDLPIRRLILYKHGVGYFERRGPVSGESLRLSFPRAAMDDVLKSLVVLDMGSGQVRGVDFETPEDRASQVARGSIHLSEARSLLDLLRDLRGRRVRLTLTNQHQPVEAPEPAEGLVIGVDVEDEKPLRAPIVSIYEPDQQRVRTFAVRDVARLELLDDRAVEDLGYFLRAAQTEEDRRIATLRLSEGQHDLLVGYVAPAPAWRISYRVLVEAAEDSGQPAPDASSTPLRPLAAMLLQGWGLFDNQLDEDLDQVMLTLVAGMPISFRYRLYEPRTPERPLVQDEERTVAAPVEFAAMAAPAASPQMMKRSLRAADMVLGEAPGAPEVSIAQASASVLPVGAGEERGALFQYRVAHPISVARGQSAMVPVVSQRLEGRKELLYNGAKLPNHPVASLRARNNSGLTLERGPLTVIEDGDYAGEAVLAFTRANGELIVPYAVELGITIREEDSSERVTAGMRVRDEYLLVQEWDVQHTLYRIKNTLAKPTELLIERTMLQGYKLHGTDTPVEQSQGQARWLVACPPAAETTFMISQRRQTSRREGVRSLSTQQLSAYLRERYLDEETYTGLSEVLAIYGQIDAHQRRLQQIEEQRKPLFERQRQTQSVLTPLSREENEGALRARYITALGELEDRINALANEEQQLRNEIARLEQEAKAALARLAA